MTLPGPGWYSDPEVPGQSRWWTGAGWSEHTQRPAAPAAPQIATTVEAPYVPMAGYASPVSETPRLKRGEKDRLTRKNNVFAWTGLLLSLIAFLFNPLMLASIIGIVFSCIGLSRAQNLTDAGARVTGRGTAIAGLVVGIAGIAAFIYVLASRFS